MRGRARTETLAEIGLFVDEDFGRNDRAEWHEHLQQIVVGKFLRQVVNKKVGTVGSCNGTDGCYE